MSKIDFDFIGIPDRTNLGGMMKQTLQLWNYKPREMKPTKRPPVVCLCGSTRFMDTFHRAAREETLRGNIVLTVSDIITYSDAVDSQKTNSSLKSFLDELHLRKIDLADEVLVLNVGGYIGESTKREIEYARTIGKRVRWWEHNIPAWKKTLNKLRRKLP